jgi:hypothetical protein
MIFGAEKSRLFEIRAIGTWTKYLQALMTYENQLWEMVEIMVFILYFVFITSSSIEAPKTASLEANCH